MNSPSSTHHPVVAEIIAALEGGGVVAVRPDRIGACIAVMMFPLADGNGFVFAEDGAWTPGYSGHPIHLVQGEPETLEPGRRWRFGGRIVVELLAEDDPHHMPALRCRAWLEKHGAFTLASRARARASASYFGPLADEGVSS
jgi:hypothetical protein